MPILCGAGMGSLANLSPFQESLPHSLSILFCILCTAKVPPQTLPWLSPVPRGPLLWPCCLGLGYSPSSYQRWDGLFIAYPRCVAIASVRTPEALIAVPSASAAPTACVPQHGLSQGSCPLSLHCPLLLQLSLSQYSAAHRQAETWPWVF